MSGGWANVVLLCLLGGGCVQEPADCSQRDQRLFFLDADGDGQGDPLQFIIACEPFEGFSASPLDCDDGDPGVRPLVPELCDGIDNDCDGQVDEGWRFSTVYPDADGDGVGVTADGFVTCATLPDHVAIGGDCDDRQAGVFPGAPELCNFRDDDCDGRVDDADDDLAPSEGARWFLDLDGDGFAGDEVEIVSCLVPVGGSQVATDCDDDDVLVNPAALEVCDGIDNDCDLLTDDSDPDIDVTTQQTWYLDVDRDGFGDPLQVLTTCTEPWYWTLDGTDCDDTDAEIGSRTSMRWRQDLDGDGVGGGLPTGILCDAPGPDWRPFALGNDCDDADPQRAPGFPERCDGIDNDCDGLVDDEDPMVDPRFGTTWFVDEDGDGFGGTPLVACEQPAVAVALDGDCDDENAAVYPGAPENCTGLDDDCDGLVDDADPDLDTAWGLNVFRDRDGDGVGDPFTTKRVCSVPPGWRALTGDCDDYAFTIGFPALWWEDADADGYGHGVRFGPSCEAPGPTFVQEAVEDCDDADPTVRPLIPEVCEDAIDQDCDGEDALCPALSCADLLVSGRSRGDGVYTIEPDDTGPHDVWCDMTTDGGGWTLVSSSNTPVDDARDDYAIELVSLFPAGAMNGLWDGLRQIVPNRTDVRFACRALEDDPDLAVDLVFYDSTWYRELTGGEEASVCFNQNDGAGYDTPVERKNLLTGSIREAGNHWDAGYLEGEDTCDSPDDFTVDFDNRGMDGNQSDGTDWGEDDNVRKCARNNQGVSWFVFIR